MHLRLGRRGERLACRLLTELGYDVLLRNYRTPHGEVDIVAREGTTMCFVEVKTRRRRGAARPAAAVGPAKQRRLIRSAHAYLRELGWPPLIYRFDIVEVLLDRARVHDARCLRGVFSEERAASAARFPDMPEADPEAREPETRPNEYP